MAFTSGVYGTISSVGTNNITGTTIASASSSFNPSYDLNSDTVCGVPVHEWQRMSHYEQSNYHRKWEEHYKHYESRSRQEQAPVKGSSSGYLNNTTLLLLEI